MKVILLKDVARIGRRYEVKDVPDGHALNFLIPRKLAEPASAESLRRVSERKGKLEESRAHADVAFGELLTKLEGVAVTLTAQANEQGHLFKGIKADEIASAVSEQVGPLASEAVVLDAPIKQVGDHEIELAWGEKRGSFTLTVVAK